MILRLPAVCADRKGLVNLIAEISRFYSGPSIDDRANDEVVQYGDLSDWQNYLLEHEETNAGRAYWQKLDRSGWGLTILPGIRRRNDHTTVFSPDSVKISVKEDQVDSIDTLGASHSLSAATLFLTCWSVLLWKYLAQSKIVIASAFDGRNYDDLGQSPGLFERYLPLSLDLRPQMTFIELARQVKQTAMDAGAWQEYFNYQPSTEPGDERFFRLCFDYQNEPPCYTADGARFTIEKMDSRIDQYHLKLTCRVSHGRPGLEIEYDQAIYPRSQIVRLAGEYETLLANASAQVETALENLTVVAEEERRQVIDSWNDTRTDYPSRCAHEMFESSAKASPDAIAVVFKEEAITYERLNGRANQLAGYLRRQGIGPDHIVGLCLERSIELVVSILGILKAGAAYLPLDPTYPEQRLRVMIEDSGCALAISATKLMGKIASKDLVVIAIDACPQALLAESEDNLIPLVLADNLAYVIFTSGSTGRPKGVMISHRALNNYLNWCLREYEVAAGIGAPVQSSIGFDLTVTSLFPPLFVGRSVYLISGQHATETLEPIAEDRVGYSLIKITPAHLDILTEIIDASRAADLTWVMVVGGEALSGKALQKWIERAPNTIIINEYGPSETTVGCCTYRVLNDDCLEGSIPIGSPIANAEVYLFNTNYQPTPVGAPGEIYIGGEGLARGYVRQPEQTAERFAPNPFSRAPGERIYKTGDLGRHWENGDLEFLGRIDDQVKLRGFRIEISEIESALTKHYSVKDACVVAKSGRVGGMRLVAYIVSSGRVTNTELREHLNRCLPEYMVPSSFVHLESLPLSQNGKVDRAALPEPEAGVAGERVEPRTPFERHLTAIWKEVLRSDQIGIHDNFFEMGGDSILSILIAAKAKQRGIGILPRDVFDHQTIAELAAVAAKWEEKLEEAEVIEGPGPLTPIQRWFFEQPIDNRNHFNQAVMLEVDKRIEPRVIRQVMQAILDRHDALRLRYSDQGGHWKQYLDEVGEAVKMEEIRIEGGDDEEVRRNIEEKANRQQSGLDIGVGPLMRCAYFEIEGRARGRLLVVVHHLAIDGVSWRILLEDLELGCEQLVKGEPLSLGGKSGSYRRWARQLEQYAISETIKMENGYWQEIVGRKVGRLPVDRPGEKNLEASVRSVGARLNREETKQLLSEVGKVYRTQINEVLIAGLVGVIGSWAGGGNVSVDMEGHGRDEIVGVDVSRTIGWFTTIYPVVIEYVEGESSGERLVRVKEEMRKIPNQGIGYGILKYVAPESESPAPHGLGEGDLCFNYLGQFDQALSLDSWFSPAAESPGETKGRAERRPYRLVVTSAVAGGEFQTTWTYDQNSYDEMTIERLSLEYVDELRRIIASSKCERTTTFSASDFPAANLTQEELSRLLQR
jgi:amino acid adenylation domain-containing protein/non-ribosomal peptide synthase protein (TIGR01720 family)